MQPLVLSVGRDRSLVLIRILIGISIFCLSLIWIFPSGNIGLWLRDWPGLATGSSLGRDRSLVLIRIGIFLFVMDMDISLGD